MKTLLFTALVAFATTTASVHADDEKTEMQKIACVEVGQTIDRDGNGNTALMVAAAYGETEIARMLVEAGANPDASNDYGSTARKLAKGYGQREIVEAFEVVPVQSSQNLVAANF